MTNRYIRYIMYALGSMPKIIYYTEERLVKMKKFITGLLVGAILSSSAVIATSFVAEPASFKVLVNGSEFTSDPPAMVINGSTYLPLRAMGNALGVPVNWNEELRQAEVGVTSQALSSLYTRTNPAPLNIAQTYKKESDWFEDDNYTVSIKVLEIARGNAIFEPIKENNLLYIEPDEGYEYLNAKISFTVTETKSDFSVSASQAYFQSFTSNNEECPQTVFTYGSKPALSGSLYSGGNSEGWITVMVKKDDPNPKLAYGLDYNGVGGIWFALYE